MGVGKDNITLSSRDRKALEAWVDKPGVPLKLIIRAWIILLSASGQSTQNVASRMGVSNSTVLLWRDRFVQGGIAALAEEKKVARPRHGDEEILKIVEATMKDFPERARRWSIRNMARFMGVSRSTVQRIWKKYGLDPKSVEFKFRHDPAFYEDCKDIAGLYVESPHVYAVALLTTATPAVKDRADDESRRSEEELLLKVLKTMRRSASGRKPARGLLEFLKWVNTHTPPAAIVHLIVPRQAQSIHPTTFRWLKRHPRFQQHVIPKHVPDRQFLSEWYVKTCEAAKTRKTFQNLPDLQDALNEFLSDAAAPTSLKKLLMPKPFVWVRPDKNYLADERQLELDLTAA